MYGFIREDFDEYHRCWIPVISSIRLFHIWYKRDIALEEARKGAQEWERYTEFKIQEK